MVSTRCLARVVLSVGVTGLLVGFVSPAWAADEAAVLTNRLPRHTHFVLDPSQSEVEFSLFAGGVRSPLSGSIRLFLGDPDVPTPLGPAPGWVGVSVDGASLTAFDPVPEDHPALPRPLHMIQDPAEKSTGIWNVATSNIRFQLHLTTPDGPLPVPQPVYLQGILALVSDAATTPVLRIEGSNGNIPDGMMTLRINAYEVPLPPPPVDIWFSTEIGFHAAGLPAAGDANTPVPVSAGDLLSARGHIVRRNRDLTRHLGIMPVVPDLGLDAVMLGPRRAVWFSFEEQNAQMWSETLGVWLKHGDLLSERGAVVQTNEQLVARFVPAPLNSADLTGNVGDLGLDAIARGANRGFLFSTEKDFFSRRLNVRVTHGDLLSSRGYIVARNAQLLRNFEPTVIGEGPQPEHYGLDVIALRANAEIWFSTELGFYDARLGWISDGDLLSTTGRVVMRNLALVSKFAPIEDAANFGLDAANIIVPVITGDYDMDGDVDLEDFGQFQVSFSGPQVASALPEVGDLDGDGDVDLEDFGLFQRCISGPDEPADPDCAE